MVSQKHSFDENYNSSLKASRFVSCTMPSSSYKACLMDLATTITGVLLSHSHSPGDVPPLEESWPSLNKVDIKIIPTDYNLWLTLCLHSSQLAQVWSQTLLLLTLPLCVYFMAAYFMAAFFFRLPATEHLAAVPASLPPQEYTQ